MGPPQGRQPLWGEDFPWSMCAMIEKLRILFCSVLNRYLREENPRLLAFGAIGDQAAGDPLACIVDDLQERLVGARIGLRQHIVVDGRKAARLTRAASAST